MTMERLFIFDFDGTLVDTATDVAVSLIEAIKKNGFTEPTRTQVISLIGQNLDTIVKTLLNGQVYKEEDLEKVKLDYKSIYSHGEKPNTAPFPGMVMLLNELKASGARLAVNSNKPEELLGQMVEQYFGKELFDCVIGYDPVRPSKPNPYGVNKIAEETGCSLENAAYIGDGMSDLKTAENADITFVYVDWGPVKMDTEDLQYKAYNVEELRSILKNL